MPVLLSLFLALAATAGFFFGIYAVVLGLLGGRKAVASPRLGIAPGEKPGTLSLWVTWKDEVFAIQIYRFRGKLFNPYGEPKEATFTVTFDPPMKGPFAQSIDLPADFKTVIEGGAINKDAIVTFDFRTVDEQTIQANYSIKKLRKIYHGAGKIPAGITNRPKTVVCDLPPVMSLDFQELTVRRKYLRELDSAAKAKAAKAAPKPAAAPAAAAAPEAAPTADVAPAAAPSDVTPEPQKAAAEIPSIKSVIAQANAKNKEAAKEKG